MKRLLTLAVIAVASAYAQPSTATITGPLALPSGALYTGSVTVSALASINVGTTAVLPGSVKCTVSVGAMSCSLLPGSYQAVYLSGFSEYWVIQGAATYTVASIRTLVAPSPSFTVTLSQISTVGATVGQCIVFNGTAWAPGNCGSSSASSWTGLTSSAWASLTSANWATLTN